MLYGSKSNDSDSGRVAFADNNPVNEIRERDWLAAAPFVILLVISCVVVFLGRSFPSQDGPLHLYYADVTRNLLLGTGLYDAGFQIHYYITPYITQTYVLVLLSSFVEPVIAEKLMVCLYVAGFCLGFRYLVRSVAPQNHTLSIFSFIFVFNYPVYKGFYNFCLGMALGFWIIGFWIRHSRQLTPKRSVMFAGLMLLMVFTHPIALGFCLMFLGLHTAVEVVWQAKDMGRWYDPAVLLLAGKRNVRSIAHVAAAALTVLWVTRFANADNDVQVASVAMAERLQEFFLMYVIVPIRMRLWRWPAMLALAAAGIAVAVYLWRQRRELRASQLSVALMSMACLAIAVVAPSKVSGGTHIAQRFALYGFVLLLAAGASTPMSPFVRKSAVACGLPVVLFILFTLGQVHRGVLARVSSVFDAPPAPPEAKIAWVVSDSAGQTKEMNWAPLRHLGAHYARRSKGVLVNFEWLNVSYMNLSPVLKHGCMFQTNQACFSTQSAGAGRPDIDVVIAGQTDATKVAALYGLDHRVSTDDIAIFSAGR